MKLLFLAHGEWIQTNYDQGTFLLMGPYTTKDMTGLVIGQVEELAELDAIIQADAFYPDYAEYSVNEFTINKINPAIADVK